ncbi:hypothetical protein [Rhodococcoides kroppenstedtii]|uniref:hypothetical protein n=1 Tax=Rhodococcoides kroppenstedtii TaxID=293050 RepID=UPI001427DBDF|nr:hypothetical protein [Rhodococcus kroppenstedtii]NIL80698.1 hypothetical protein [Rhodococcus kroppenstedtii]
MVNHAGDSMGARREPRMLRPRFVFHVAGRVWVVDETRPVAALFDPRTAEFETLTSWTELPAAPPGGRPSYLAADDTGLWVQNDRGGPLARVTADGIDRAEYTDGRALLGAGRSGAWCFTTHRRRQPALARTADTPPPPFPRQSFLVALPGGGTRTVPVVDAGVVSFESDENHLHIGLEHHPWSRTPVAGRAPDSPGFEAAFAASVSSIPLHGPVPARIEPGTAHRNDQRTGGYTSEYADLTYNEAHYRKRASDGDVRWYWGLESRRSATTVINAYRGDTVVFTTKWTELRVVDGTAAGGRLWAITRPDQAGARGVTVLDPNGDTTPIPATAIDVTDHRWPLGPRPLDHASYVRHCLGQLGALSCPDGITDFTATYEGEWPHGQVHVSYRHADYPGLTLTARRNIYDENGARLDRAPDYIAHSLVEQAGTGAYPPVDRAVDGVLWI